MFLYLLPIKKIYVNYTSPVKEGENIDRALKRFKRKFDRTGAMKSLRSRQAFIKPSVRNRDKIKKASYVQGLRDLENI